MRAYLSLTIVAGLTVFSAAAGMLPPGVDRSMVATAALPNVPGHSLTAVTVELGPGVTVPAHKHAGFVFVYVLEGVVRSQLDDGEIIEYAVGDSWVEPPDAVHTLTQNPSETQRAKILAVFVAKDGAKLTTSGPIAD